MKTIRNYSLMVLCCITFLACHKDLPDPPKPVTIFHTVTILPADGVTISPTLSNNSIKVEDGKSISFNFNSDASKRYKILSSGVAVTSFMTGNFYYLIPSVTSDLNLQVVSEVVTNTVTVTASVGGTVTPLGTTEVEYGKDLTINITENSEYTLTSIKVGETSVPISKPYVLKNVTAKSDVKIEFTLTNFLTLSNGADNKSRPWIWTHWDRYDENHVFEYSYVLHQDQSTWRIYYYSDGKTEVFSTAGTLVANGFWSVLLGGIFKDGSQPYPIIELSDKKFVYEQKAEFTQGLIEIMRFTYERQ